MRVGIVGATGVLGRQVVPRLVERGHVVRSIVRRESDMTRLPGLGIDAIVGDILQPDSLSKGLKGCDSVLHLATAIPRAGTPNPDWSLNDRVRRDGTANLVGACRKLGIERYVQQSIAERCVHSVSQVWGYWWPARSRSADWQQRPSRCLAKGGRRHK